MKKKLTQSRVVKSLGVRKKSPPKNANRTLKKSPSKTLKRAYSLPKNANRMVNQGSLRFNKRNTNRVRNMTLYEFLRLPGAYETLMKLRPPKLGSLRN